MSAYPKRDQFYSLFFNGESSLSLIDYLNGSSADEICLLDFEAGKFHQLYSVEGKYFVPVIDSTYKSLFEFTLKHIIHPDDVAEFIDLMEPEGFIGKLENSPLHHFRYAQFRYRLQDGSYRWVEQCIITGKENGLEENKIMLYVFDIENLKQRELGLAANDETVISQGKDNLTGLYKGKGFFEKAQEIVDNNKTTKWCVISIDIEHFKLFDEWYGRAKGDMLLHEIGTLFIEKEKEINSLFGYFGQDDFGALLPYDDKLIKSLFEETKNVIINAGYSLGFMPAFGICEVKGNQVLDAFDRASIAASKSKGDIKNRITIYDEKMQYATDLEYRILSDFMVALKNKEITFYLQPQCRISTGKIVGAESLARWIKPNGDIIWPNDFIPILEKYGFIADLDQYLWERVCVWLREIIDQGYTPVPISLNVSRADIFSIDIPEFFIELTEKYNIPRHLLKLEITESAYIETTNVIADLVNKLRNNGFLVLMDDFGSGYSSLNMLSNLEVDAVKLDAGFLNIDNDETSRGIRILESIVNMTKIISLPIIVEGVENQTQNDFLEELGCRYVQGFFYHRPMPVKDFMKILGDKDRLDLRGFVAKHNEQFRIREFLDKNVYSDAMLNNIIGAVAFYAWHDEHIDIVRFNEQFYKIVNVPDFDERLTDIQQFCPPGEPEHFYSLLQGAIDNKFSGSIGLIRTYRTDGTLATFMIHFYYLGEKDGSKRFYGSASDVTELASLQAQIKLISRYSSDSIILIGRHYDEWTFTVTTNGLAEKLELDIEQFQEKLNDGSYVEHLSKDGQKLIAFLQKELEAGGRKDSFSKPIEFITTSGKRVNLIAKFDYVDDKNTNVEYILTLRVV